MKFGIIVFPGSNCDHDCYHVVKKVMGEEAGYIWHKDSDLDEADCVIVPGGFSYGDYLRCGAIAKLSPVMDAIKDFASKGGMVIGICNGFQILCESGLLPGAMVRNASLKFICEDVHLKVERYDTAFTSQVVREKPLRMPIAHAEGCFFADDGTINRLEDNGQVLFRYCSEDGDVNSESNPNASRNNIAGIINEKGNVLGMMPHPERLSEKILGGDDGKGVFESIIQYLNN